MALSYSRQQNTIPAIIYLEEFKYNYSSGNLFKPKDGEIGDFICFSAYT